MEPAPAEPHKIVRDLSHDLMSPYCPGRTIASCPSQQARKLEDDILEQAEAGNSREQIEQTLVARFGPEIIGYKGRPIVIYGSAAAALVAALALVVVGRRWVQGSRIATARAAGGAGAPAGEPTSASPTDVSQREMDALDDALDEIDEF